MGGLEIDRNDIVDADSIIPSAPVDVLLRFCRGEIHQRSCLERKGDQIEYISQDPSVSTCGGQVGQGGADQFGGEEASDH